MRCLVCKKDYDDEIDNCPLCGRKLVADDLDIELPQLKEEFFKNDDVEEFDSHLFDEIDNEKTIMIKPLEVDDEPSLIDDINKQIEEINDNAAREEVVETPEDVEEESTDDNIDLSDTLKSDDSIRKRKSILLVVGIFSLLLLTIIVIILAISLNKEESTRSEDYMTSLTKSLEAYYYGNDIDDVIYVLEDIKEDAAKVKEAQNKTKTTCESWVLLFLEEDIDNKDKLELTTSRYKELINGLYRYAIVTTNDGVQIRLLTESDYDSITKEFDDVYSDSSDFFGALEYYTNRDYNKAYYLFDKITEENSYYDKGITYKNKIVEEIINLLKNDLNNLEKNMDTLSVEEKLEKYTQMEEIILEYNNIYINVELNEKDDYQELLSKYTTKVGEYTEIVANAGSNPSNSIT